jgi:hypothetical protein
LVRRPEGFDLLTQPPEDRGRIDMVLGVEGVVVGPVLELTAKDGDQPREGMATGTDQMSQEVFVEPLPAGVAVGDLRSTFVPELVPLSQEWGGVVFFSGIATGEGGTRGRWAMM